MHYLPTPLPAKVLKLLVSHNYRIKVGSAVPASRDQIRNAPNTPAAPRLGGGETETKDTGSPGLKRAFFSPKNCSFQVRNLRDSRGPLFSGAFTVSFREGSRVRRGRQGVFFWVRCVFGSGFCLLKIGRQEKKKQVTQALWKAQRYNFPENITNLLLNSYPPLTHFYL